MRESAQSRSSARSNVNGHYYHHIPCDDTLLSSSGGGADAFKARGYDGQEHLDVSTTTDDSF